MFKKRAPQEEAVITKESLRNFTKEENAIKVDSPIVLILSWIWNGAFILVGVILGIIGLITLIRPELRECLFDLCLQFFVDIGIVH